MGGNQSSFYFVDFEFPKKPAQHTVRKTIGLKQPIQNNGKFYRINFPYKWHFQYNILFSTRNHI